MRKLVKALFGLVLLGVAGLVGFTVVSELPAPTREITVPVEVR